MDKIDVRGVLIFYGMLHAFHNGPLAFRTDLLSALEGYQG